MRQNLGPGEEGLAVKKRRFSAEQIVGILKQAEVGVSVGELVRKVGISEQTFYRWKKQYIGLEIDQARQLKQLQEENHRLKRLVERERPSDTGLAGRNNGGGFFNHSLFWGNARLQ